MRKKEHKYKKKYNNTDIIKCKKCNITYEKNTNHECNLYQMINNN